MIIKDPKKLAQRMMILCILIGLVALVVAIIAMFNQQHLIAFGMAAVAIIQIWNYKLWKQKAR
ncbi:hypothetical protein [Phocaeicola sp.]